MENEVVIDVRDVTIRFNMASEKIDNLKEYFVKLVKRELLFQEFLAVKNASFLIRIGEAWGLIGSHGSGKSTLLKAICGVLKPYKGEIIRNGNISPLLELGAGFDQNLTARENIFLNGTILGHSMEYMREHFDEIVEFAELQDFLDAPIKNFSSGMRARLGFAVATIVDPDILIVDEVLAVGDYAFQQKCLKRMAEMLSGGTTLLFVSHSIDQVKNLCDHAVWINKGDIMKIGEVEEVCDAYMATQQKK
ncbi:MAG: ABC transporter ATP-binding protein [Lachnospiraceae bacterium]|nr:ABC transporter ATP-binding protein [Lachnospiraceae bacterium]